MSKVTRKKPAKRTASTKSKKLFDPVHKGRADIKAPNMRTSILFGRMMLAGLEDTTESSCDLQLLDTLKARLSHDDYLSQLQGGYFPQTYAPGWICGWSFGAALRINLDG